MKTRCKHEWVMLGSVASLYGMPAQDGDYFVAVYVGTFACRLCSAVKLEQVADALGTPLGDWEERAAVGDHYAGREE